MSVETALATAISAGSASLTGAYHIRAIGTTPDRPYATFELIDSEPLHAFSPTVAITNHSYRVHIYTEEIRGGQDAQAQATAIGAELRAALEGHSDATITSTLIDNDFDGELADDEIKMGHRIVDLRVHAR